MKKAKRMFSAILAYVTLALFSVSLPAQTPTLTPSVNDTWRVHVSTLKASVKFYSASSISAAHDTIQWIKQWVTDKYLLLMPMAIGLVLIAGLYALSQYINPLIPVGVLFFLSSLFLPKVTHALHFAPTESLDPATLGAQLSDFYQEHKEGIHANMELGLFEGKYSVARQFTLLPGVVDELVLDSATVEDFIHQHLPSADETFNPLADVLTPDARILKVRDYEGDLQFRDKQIERTHLMWKGKMKQLEKTESPEKTQNFIEYLFWDIITAKANRALRKALFQATFAQTAGFSSTKILNGFEKVVTDEITATTITAVTTGAITTSNVISKIEEVYDTLHETVQDADDLVCVLNADTYKKYIRADRLALGRSSTFDAAKDLFLDENSNCPIIREPDLNTTKIAFYQKNNAFVGTNSGAVGSWEFQRFDRLTKMMCNGKIGFQFQTVNAGGQNNVAIGR